ncbi:nephrin [Clarias gariepinus]|uniref:nephrin n=1 Tax=Clarias gariepinus TaxID=13013 RepID=UPI00234E02E8|nr:nephrin [Clarias gariepinus]
MAVLSSLVSSILLLLVELQGVCGQQAFRTEPRNVTVRAGATALLKCEVLRASGTVQWVKDGLLLGPHRSLPGHPRYTMTGDENRGQYHLQIKDVRLEDDSPYECQVGRSETSHPIVSRTVWINVQIPPSKPRITQDSEEPWVEGNEYTVTCIAPDAKPAADIILFKDGEMLTDTTSYTTAGSEDKLLDTYSKVTIRPHRSDDGRPLLCRVKNPALSQALETKLLMKVYFPPQPPVIEGLRGEEVKAGTYLRLVCLSYGGNPLATLHWTKNSEVLSTNWELDINSGKASSTLLMDVKPEDNNAVLQCESGNQVTRSPMVITRTISVLFEPSNVELSGSSEAIEGTELNMWCSTSSSNPPAHIRWWLGSKELNTTDITITEGENGGMMTFSNLTHTVSREEDRLLLTCEAFNKGTRFSKIQTKTLTVYYPPQKVWLDAPKKGTFLRSGMIIRLVCFSSGGNPTGRLTWLKNNKVVQTTSKHIQSERGVSREFLLTLQPSDNLATYRCEATNEAKKVRSAETTLEVQFPAVSLKIVVKKKKLHAGETIKMECLAGSSKPTANISWSLGSTSLLEEGTTAKNSSYGGVSVTSVLALPLSSHLHGSRITCQAFSAALSERVNTFYTLNVLFPPEFAEDQPSLIPVSEDNVARLPVKVSGNPDDIACEWIFQDEKVLRDRDHRYHFPQAWDLEIWNVTRRDAGVYTVECSNAEGKNSTNITLDVQYPPIVKMKTDPVQVNVGDTADLFCIADANPVTDDMFSWKWMGDGEREDLGESSQDESTGLLTVYEVTRAHAGPYQCTANNGIAPPASVVGQLVVRFAPELQKGPQWKKVASRGDGTTDADVICQAEGVPRVQFTWAKNRIPLNFDNPRYLERTVKEGAIHTSTLTVVNVSAVLDYAVFTCTARNSLGEDTLDIQLLSTNYPDPPSDLKLLRVSSNSVTLEWMPGFDGGLTQNFRVRYKWAGSASYLYVDVFPPRSTVYTVSGLNPSTTYNFSVNAINSIGESGYADNGAILNVTTKDPDPAGDETHPEAPKREEVQAIPVYVIPILVGIFLLGNALGFFLLVRWRKGQSLKEGAVSFSEGKRSDEGSSVSSREPINASAQRTLLINTSSEVDTSGSSSIYECYGESNHYYYPTDAFSPALYTHLETPEKLDSRNITNPFNHDYEEVRDIGPYQDLFGLNRLPSTTSTYKQGAWFGAADLYPVSGVNNYTTYNHKKNSELPFELRGELV